ncbi:hypothetical protein H9P43_007811 [Blastocladiella emersonii ATCC 22665]|nr:hypothetical protein H9P43_007811 [Blastocladiella emersonii ATCC 22665]
MHPDHRRAFPDEIIEEILILATNLNCYYAKSRPEGELDKLSVYLCVLPRYRAPKLSRFVARRLVDAGDAALAVRNGELDFLEFLDAAGVTPFKMCGKTLFDAIEKGFDEVTKFWRGQQHFVDFTYCNEQAFKVALQGDVLPGVAPGDAAIAGLVDGIASGQIETVKLEAKRISDNGIDQLNRALASPSQRVSEISLVCLFRCLPPLNLSLCKLDMQDLARIVPALPDALDFLELRGNPIGDTIVELFRSRALPALSLVSLNGTAVSEAAKAEMQGLLH